MKLVVNFAQCTDVLCLKTLVDNEDLLSSCIIEVTPAQYETSRVFGYSFQETRRGIDCVQPIIGFIQNNMVDMQVGKSTLIKCLVRHYTRQTANELRGPITVIAGKKRRLTFVECPSDINGMIDAAKFADLVLLCVDGSFGFEMETFEFLNLLQVIIDQLFA